MKKRILWLGLSFLLVASLMLASCAEEVVEEEEEEEEEVGAPQYGGTLTQIHGFTNNEPPDWDPHLAAGPMVIVWSAPVMEQAIEGDIVKYGPRGTGEYGFTNPGWVDEPYYKGNTVESWEWRDPLTLVFKVRPGIHFSGESVNPGVMEAREFTADDFVYHLQRMKTSPNKGQLWDWVADTYAEGKYTWVVEFAEYYSDWTWWLASAFVQIYPEEVVEAGPSDWKNLVGTGPFILTDYVRGTGATYERNPDYWGKATINGKEYQLPFIDKLIWPVIPDEATRIASLRTGKIDWATQIPAKYVETLADTSPDMVRFPWLSSGSLVVVLQSSTSEYFTDENVRRAMMIGTDLQAIADGAWGVGNADINPTVRGSAIYTPIEDMPASLQELFTYDLEKARQMLADAGYPDGFDMEMTYDPSGAGAEDIASIIVAMWDDLGVNVRLKPVESAVLINYVYAHDYTDALLAGRGFGTAGVVLANGVYGHEEDTADWYSEWYTNAYNEAMGEPDAVKSLALKKEMNIVLLDAAAYIPTAVTGTNAYIWPWVQNYYGEISGGFTHFNPMLKLLWIDQDLKADMGY